MNYGNALVGHLRQYLKDGLGDTMDSVTTSIKGIDFVVNVFDMDKFSFILHCIELKSKDVQDELPLSALRVKAEALKEKLCALFEPLALGEIDAVNRRLQLRSIPPDDLALPFRYYELELNGDRSVKFGRFTNEKAGAKRSRDSFLIADDGLVKVVNTLAEAVIQ